MLKYSHFSGQPLYGQDNTGVLRRFLQSVQQPQKGMGNHSLRGFRNTPPNHRFLTKGLKNKTYDSNTAKTAFEPYFTVI